VSVHAESSTSPFADPALAFVACKAFGSVMRASDARLLAWVLMPDHGHWLIELGERERLSVLVARLKSASAGACNSAAGNTARTSVWQAGFYDRAIRRDEDVLAVARYIVANPLRARLVQRLGDYSWWDAAWL
jgi:putative transposase